MAGIERWLPVVGYERTHEVSDLGRVRSLDRNVEQWNGFCTIRRFYPGKMLIQKYKNNRGVSYYRVKLTALQEAGERTAWVHTLMLEAFVGLPLEGQEAAHLDGNTRNNVLTNVAWKTTYENYQDRLRHGTQKLKVSTEQVAQIRADIANGATQKMTGKKYGISQTQAGRIARFERRAAE